MPVKNGLLVCTNGVEPCFFKRFTFKIGEQPEGDMRFVGIAGDHLLKNTPFVTKSISCLA